MKLKNFSTHDFTKHYLFHQKIYYKREISLFSNDLENHKQKLFSEINSKSILIVGGAGTIGSSFIKAAKIWTL